MENNLVNSTAVTTIPDSLSVCFILHWPYKEFESTFSDPDSGGAILAWSLASTVRP